jgi:cell division protein FtsN
LFYRFKIVEMKKIFVFGMCATVLVAITSCGTSKSAYKKAYEKAQQEQTQKASEATAPVQAVTTTPQQEQQTSTAPSNVRQEKVNVVSGDDNLKDFNVVAGSFGNKNNAENLKDFLIKEGYNNAAIAFNSSNSMYRVIVSTFSDYNTAAQARDAFKNKYPGNKEFQNAWLFYRTK